MSTTRHPGFPTVLAQFAGEYVRTATANVVYVATFSLVAVVVVLLAVPDHLVLLGASVLSYGLHLAAFEFRGTTHPASLSDVFDGDSLTHFGAVLVGLFVGYTTVYLASLTAAVLVVGATGHPYAGLLVAMYLPVVDVLGNRVRWYLSVQVLAVVAYLAVVRGLGIVAPVRHSSVACLVPGYRFEGPTPTSTTPRR